MQSWLDKSWLAGASDPLLNTVGLKHWFLDTGTQRLAGSPHEGQTMGDHLLQRNQLFGWTLEPETLQQIRPPARVIVTLTSGEAIDGGIVNW